MSLDCTIEPKRAEKGLHIINVKVLDYEDLIEEVESSFQIISEGGEIRFYFFILLGTIVLVGILIVVVIFIGRKKK